MATVKKIPNEDYLVQLTLSPKEARYLSVITARVCGIKPLNDIWTKLEGVVGEPGNLNNEPTFNYESLSMATRDWVASQ